MTVANKTVLVYVCVALFSCVGTAFLFLSSLFSVCFYFLISKELKQCEKVMQNNGRENEKKIFAHTIGTRTHRRVTNRHESFTSIVAQCLLCVSVFIRHQRSNMFFLSALLRSLCFISFALIHVRHKRMLARLLATLVSPTQLNAISILFKNKRSHTCLGC